jgi:glycosyltransferase involved in cell wall biosynthesis
MYVDQLRDFIETNGLKHNVKILGLINYCDVLFLMRNSLAVLNPSNFEGWSSSVEEAKSMGKSVILSRIGVHVEQNPPNGRYFEPDDAIGLSQILADAWTTPAVVSHDEAEQNARDVLQKRTVEFGKAYLNIVNDVMRGAELRTDPSRVDV